MKKIKGKHLLFVVFTIILTQHSLSEKTLIAYFLPMEPQAPLVSKGTRGEIFIGDNPYGPFEFQGEEIR